MISNKIRVFLLVLVIVVVCESRTASKKSKLTGKKDHSSKHSLKKVEDWDYSVHEDCAYDPLVDIFDTDFHSDNNEEFELPAWEGCGLNRFSSKKTDSALKKKWRSFQQYFSEIEQSIEDLKSSFGKGSGDRIIQGKPVYEGEWPWLACIGRTQIGQFCGGTIIDDRWILTAAHCFNETIRLCDYTVRVGVTNWKIDPEGHGEDRKIAGVYAHPDYDKFSKQNDIALLKLDKPLDIKPNSHINVACLPEGGRSVKPQTPCKVAGWGQIEDENTDSWTVAALQADMPVIGYHEDQCGEYPEGQLLPGMLCAGHTDGTQDTCQGDSGGPLTCKNDEKFYVLGVTSFGFHCALKGYPGVYTDVGQYLPFIGSVMRRHS